MYKEGETIQFSTSSCMFEFPPSKPPQPAAKGHSLSIDDEQAQKEEEEEMPTRSAWSAVVFVSRENINQLIRYSRRLDAVLFVLFCVCVCVSCLSCDPTAAPMPPFLFSNICRPFVPRSEIWFLFLVSSLHAPPPRLVLCSLYISCGAIQAST